MNLKQLYRKLFACPSCGNTSTHADGCQRMKRRKNLTRKTGIMAVLLVLIISSGSATTSIHLINDLGDGNQDDKYSPPVAGDTGSGTYYKISQEFCTSKTFYADRIQLYDFKYGDINSDEWALVDVYLNQGEADSQFAEGTKVKSGLNMTQGSSNYNIQFDSSYKVSSGNCYEFEMVTYDTNSDGDSYEDGIKGPYDNSSSTTKFYSNTAGSKSIYLKAEIFGEQKPVLESSSTSPSTWRYQDQPGFTANITDPDITASGLNGTFKGETLHSGSLTSGITWVKGAYGSALNFSANSERVQISNPGWNFTDQFTASAYVYPYSDVDGERTILSRSEGVNQFHLFYRTDETFGNRTWFRLFDRSGNQIQVRTENGENPPINEWTQVTVTYDGSEVRIYYDGNLIQTSSVNAKIQKTNSDMAIGAKYDGTSGMSAGYVDSVGIWNRSFSSSKVEDLYKGNKYYRDGILAYWRFDKGSGFTAYDTHHRVSQYNNNSISGDAVSFDGKNDYITQHYYHPKNFTFITSFKYRSHDDYGRLFQQGGTVTNVPYNGWDVEFSSSNEVLNLIFWKGSNGNKLYQSSTKLEPDTKYYLAVKGNGDKGELRIYDSEGNLLESGTGTGSRGGIGKRKDFFIAAGDDSYVEAFYDNTYFYNESFSDSRIDKIVSENQFYQKDMLFAYRFDNATNYYADSRGQNVLDYSIVPDVKLDVEEAGSLIKDQVQLSAGKNLWKWNAWTQYSISDAFTLDKVNVFYNATLTAEDQDQLTATRKFEQYIKDSPPQIDLITPKNKTYYTYDLNYSWDTFKDGDDVLQETLDCTLDRDAEQIIRLDKTEGNGETGGGIDSDLGFHNTTLSCTENQGAQQTSSETTWFTVDLMKIFTATTDSDPVYETENISYTVKVNPGSMVNNLTSTLYWDGRKLQDGTQTAGTGNVTLELFQEVPLVDLNNTAVDWRKQVTAAYNDFQASTTSEKSENTTQRTQNVWWSYYIKNGDTIPADGKYIEKEDYGYNTTVYKRNDKATIQGTTIYHRDGSKDKMEKITSTSDTATYQGIIDTGRADSFNKSSFNTSSKFTIKFNGDSRKLYSGNDTVQVYRIRLTNGNQGLNSAKSLVFDILYEENNYQTKAQLAADLSVWKTGEVTRRYNFQFNPAKQHEIYIYPSWATYTIQTKPYPDQTKFDLIQYWNDNTGKVRRSYFFPTPEKISSSITTVPLYTINSSEASQIDFSITDSEGDPAGKVYCRADRKFAGGDFNTVFMIKTGSEGKSQSFAETNEIYYSFTCYKNGQVQDRFSAQLMQNPMRLQLGEGSVKTTLDYYQKFDADCTSNVTHLKCDYQSSTTDIKYAKLEVFKKEVKQDIKICSDKSKTATGRITCSGLNSTKNSYSYNLDGYYPGGISVPGTSGFLGQQKKPFPGVGLIMVAVLFMIVLAATAFNIIIGIGAGTLVFILTSTINWIVLTPSQKATLIAIAIVAGVAVKQ